MYTSCLNTIPQTKLNAIFASLDASDLQDKNMLKKLFDRYYSANIPIEYWNLKFGKDFKGSEIISTLYTSYTERLKENYLEGKSFMIAGMHGVGKTFMITSILKHATQKNYNSLYTTLSDIVSAFTMAPHNDRFPARTALLKSDLLAIDEFDSRFILSGAASDLYSSVLETVLRTRLMNKLPTFISTNSPNILKSLGVQEKNTMFQESLTSLFNKLDQYTVFGEDFRAKK